MGSVRDQNHREAEMKSMTIDAAAIRLTDAILGDDGPDLEQTLKAIAANIGVLHIARMLRCVRRKVRTQTC
jgi:hypothetical protein